MIYNGNMEELGIIIKQAMLATRIKQKDICEKLGQSKGTVSSFLSGDRPNPTLDTLKSYADAIGCDLHIDFVPRTTEPRG